jgi:hypothetical protein
VGKLPTLSTLPKNNLDQFCYTLGALYIDNNVQGSTSLGESFAIERTGDEFSLPVLGGLHSVIGPAPSSFASCHMMAWLSGLLVVLCLTSVRADRCRQL